MGDAYGCNIPEDLYYDVERHVWARPEADGTVTIGLSAVAVHLAGTVVAVAPKKEGRRVEKTKSTGTLESGKWVGAVPSPLTGEIVAVNSALQRQPALINQDPYGVGWFVRLQPADWERDRADLQTGPAAVAAYRTRMERDDIRCDG